MSEDNGTGETVNISDLIVALKRSDNGFMLLNRAQSRPEMIQAFGELQIAMLKEILKFDAMANIEREKSKTIIPAKGGIKNFIRGGLK